jgi:transcriptional regulator with XRE-family HTH domain
MGPPPIPESALRDRLRFNLRALRQARGLTVQSAAALAKVHWRHWQKIEAGEINVGLQTLQRLAQAMKVDAADLLRDPPLVLN